MDSDAFASHCSYSGVITSAGMTAFTRIPKRQQLRRPFARERQNRTFRRDVARSSTLSGHCGLRADIDDRAMRLLESGQARSAPWRSSEPDSATATSTNSSGSPCSRPTPSFTPALFTSASRCPSRCSRIVSTAEAQALGTDISAATNSHAIAARCNSVCTSLFRCQRRYPRSRESRLPRRNPRTIAAPIPLAPPVTRTTLPFSCRSIA